MCKEGRRRRRGIGVSARSLSLSLSAKVYAHMFHPLHLFGAFPTVPYGSNIRMSPPIHCDIVTRAFLTASVSIRCSSRSARRSGGRNETRSTPSRCVLFNSFDSLSHLDRLLVLSRPAKFGSRLLTTCLTCHQPTSLQSISSTAAAAQRVSEYYSC